MKTEKQSDGPNGGKRAGAGRKKNVPNKRTAEVQRQVEASGITPLQYMLDIMRSPDLIEAEPAQQIAHNAMRFEAAKSAAPYVHSKLSSVEMNATVTNHEAALEDLE